MYNVHHPVKVGMIGVGRHARSVLLPALLGTTELKLVCACTSRPGTAAEVEDTYRLKCYVGYEKMLQDADIEGVIVVGGRQEEEILACLEAGKHVFSETPGITTLDGAEKIINLRDKRDKVVMIGRCLRFAPIYRQMKQELEKWRREDSSPRMVITRYYPAIDHIYDLLLFLNGRISQLSVFGDSNQRIASLKFTNGDIGSVIMRAFNNCTPEYEMVEISGMGGVLRAVNGNDLIFHRTSRPLSPLDTEFGFDNAHYEGNLANFSFPYAGMRQLFMRGYIPELENFAACIRSGSKNLSAVEDSILVLSIRKALEKAAESGKWTDVNYTRSNK